MIRFYSILALLFVGSAGLAQQTRNLAAGYYTVVGAYDAGREEYAGRYVKQLQDNGEPANYGFDESRNLFLVYLKGHTTLKEALSHGFQTRKKNEFSKAWVRVIPGVIGNAADQEQPIISEAAVENSAATNTSDKKSIEPPAEKPQEHTIKTEGIPVQEHPVTTEQPEEKILQPYPVNLGNTEIFLSLFNAANNRIIDGEVLVVDTDRGQLLKTVKGNEYMTLPDPKNQSGKISLICDVFGYRKLQYEINYRHPESDTAQAYVDMMGLSFVVNFDLVRYTKGDIRTLSHVYFYNDAAVMMPESRYEINQLLQMMTENPKMKIRLHGHTNGDYHGKIIKMGTDKNFFSIGNSSTSTIGSAKDLSYGRADVIRQYLITNNIAAERIDVKAWGGKKPLFDKHSANARKNVRVEVELLAN